MARSTTPDKDGYFYFAEIVTTHTEKYDSATRSYVEVEPWTTTARYGPYSAPGTARGVATQMSSGYNAYRGKPVGSISRVKVSDFEPVLRPEDELRKLRSEVEELRFRLRGLEK